MGRSNGGLTTIPSSVGSVNLDDIPSGSLCVIDTNVLLYAERRIFDSPKKQVDRSGNEFFTVGFNLI